MFSGEEKQKKESIDPYDSNTFFQYSLYPIVSFISLLIITFLLRLSITILLTNTALYFSKNCIAHFLLCLPTPSLVLVKH